MKIFIFALVFFLQAKLSWGAGFYLYLGEVTCTEGIGGVGWSEARRECAKELRENCHEMRSEIKPTRDYTLGSISLDGISFVDHGSYEDWQDDYLHVSGSAECSVQKILSKKVAEVIAPAPKENLKRIKKVGKVSCYKEVPTGDWDYGRKICQKQLEERCLANKPELLPHKKYTIGAMSLEGIAIKNHGDESSARDVLYVSGKADCNFEKIPK